MKRRDFITLLGGAAAWPLAARAQQAERMWRIGVLMALAGDDPVAKARVGAFLEALQRLGWVEGRNLRIDYRWSVGNTDQLRRDAAELVALTPDVVLATAALRSGIATGNQNRADRIRAGLRSSRSGLRRQLGAAGR